MHALEPDVAERVAGQARRPSDHLGATLSVRFSGHAGGFGAAKRRNNLS